MRDRLAGDQGSAALEMALVTPALLLVLVFIVTLGRLATARQDVDNAAAQAARAASLAPDVAQAQAMAAQAASAAASAQSLPCAGLAVSVNTSSFHPGGNVAVQVSCSVALSRLSGVALPGSKQLTARAVEVVDTYANP